MCDDFDTIVALLTRAATERASPRVAVDGVGASGKTRFASRLAERFTAPVVVVHGDDFFNPPSVRHARGRNSPEGFWLDAYDVAALTAEVLRPSGAPDGALVLVEGTFLHRDGLAGLWDFSVFLDVPFDEAARRMSERDGLAPDDARHGRYRGAQQLYFEAARPWERASLVVDATRPDAPRIIDASTSAAARVAAASSAAAAVGPRARLS
ncbi:uridine kinase [Luteimicrobium sp. DT211]|uniref:uridine kinase n=1 Tax=Luteimicrobium sp. DT211 TaxID=3393412 RepID=UPI003CF54B27